MYSIQYDSPIGKLTLAADDEGLRHILLPSSVNAFEPPEHWTTNAKAFSSARTELDAYFAGTLQRFTVKLAPRGTEFQQQVWRALLSIGYADTCTYGQIAANIGKPKASRAVGAANGANPIPILIPCHRVVGANGTLTGFSGGLATKAWLLSHEKGEGQLFDLTTPAIA